MSTSKTIDKEIDLQEVLTFFFHNKFLLIAFTVFGVALSALVAYKIPNTYTSEATLVGAAEEKNNLERALSRIGNIGNISQLGGRNRSNNVNLALHIAKSRQFMTDFSEKRGLAPILLAGKSWSIEQKRWQYDSEIYNENAKDWVDPNYSPSNAQIYRALSEIISITTDPQTQLITISFTTQSPETSQTWANWYINDINEKIKNMDVQEAKESIKFLNSQIEKTAVTEMLRILNELLAEQTKSVMLAQSRHDYALKVIDPPNLPDIKSGPHRIRLIFIGAIIGMCLGFVTSLIKLYGSGNKP